ncbi:MAG: methyltransferase domain-containing protein [Humidesulfovibrio sp.]|uniref:class I SAM-dependent methyltransferase n=1 Tax=Humidesulfovibrio sp. TaxID=2910988 RepID=UPI0027FA2467|nr:methyltransferase domain-containing protein [Humidesulfovibrio sp.]MDQ7834249.1 methyltransferase domain-containing protein [Humidesulfovibrio sp.]
MHKSIYLNDLSELSVTMNAVPNTPFTAFAKMLCLTTMNMRYERIAFDRGLSTHPYVLTGEVVRDTLRQFRMLMEIAFIEGPNKTLESFKDSTLANLHKELWQQIWPRHDSAEYDEFVQLKAHRLKVNALTDLIQGKRCVEFGCGNGAFTLSMLQCGAAHATGMDFGANSVEFARSQAERLGLAGQTNFFVSSVLDTGLDTASFDFAVSNGVFHHLQAADMPRALAEAARVLKPGGWFWYYIDGKGAISMDLWDTTVDIMKEVDLSFMEGVLKMMNVSRNKAVHIMDGSNAIYIHSTLEETIAQLDACGFENFRRLTGGTGTDLDADVVEADPFGEAKFGCGDLRILCQRKGG